MGEPLLDLALEVQRLKGDLAHERLMREAADRALQAVAGCDAADVLTDLAASVMTERRDHWIEAATTARAEVARLTRILAVECGDQTQAPPGWIRWGEGWTRRIPAPDGIRWTCTIQRFGMSDRPARWERRGIRFDDPRHREWPTALEAMEAIDAEVADG
jgi:hypothetical protein